LSPSSSAATALCARSCRADVALRPSVNVVFSLQKGELEKEARKRKGTKHWTENCERERRSRLLIGTSQLPAASQLAYAHLVCSFSSLVFLSLVSSSRSLARNTFFSSVTSVPASRFTSAISHLDICRNVSGWWKRRTPLMDSILYQIGNRLVVIVVIRCAAR